MFNLIITIIAIALVVVLTATSIFYGGSAFSNGAADAIAATFINQAQQVQAASTLFAAQNGGAPASVTALQTANFLTTVPVSPSGGTWALNAEHAFVASTIGAVNDNSTITAEVCDRINETGSGLVLCNVGADASAAHDAAVTARPDVADLTGAVFVAVAL